MSIKFINCLNQLGEDSESKEESSLTTSAHIRIWEDLIVDRRSLMNMIG